jgi:hypothetical protein
MGEGREDAICTNHGNFSKRAFQALLSGPWEPNDMANPMYNAIMPAVKM